jgi:hypothetical protein
MSFALLLVPLLALGVAAAPVWLLRRAGARPTRPEVVRNTSIAYALRMAALGPLFLWGAGGDLWPAILAAASLALGILLVHRLRLPLLVFLHGALARDRSITVHAFIARQHGGDPRVRRLGAGLTLCALVGLLVGEALGLAAFLAPLAPAAPAAVALLALGALAAAVLPAIVAGHSGALHSAQLQLGLAYFGLFGAAAVLLYLHLETRTALPPHGALAIALFALGAAALLVYRRSKYVDTEPIAGGRALSRFAKILNPCVSLLVVLTIVLALMALYAAAPGAIALPTQTRLPAVALLALCLLPLCYPLVDVALWRNLAAVAADLGARELAPGRRAAALRGVFRMGAAESALAWLFLCLLGAIAVTALGAPDVPASVAALAAADDAVSGVALALLLVCALAVAASTMSVLVSAALCTLRYDLAPAAVTPVKAGIGLVLAAGAAFVLAAGPLAIGFGSDAFLAWMFAFVCAQLAATPLVAGPLVGAGRVPPGWALAVLAVGAASGVAAVVAYVVTGTQTWLWAAVPACLGSGLVLYAVGRSVSRGAG